MVKVIYLLLFTLFTFGSFAQVPQAINYQGILRNSDGQSVPNKNITLRLTILSFKPNADIGSVEYSEEIKTKTNEFGIYTLAIGKGTPIKGQFSSILWGKSTTKVQIDIDENQTNNFEFAGTLELASVPYALYAETAKYAENSSPGTNGLNGATWLSGTTAPASNVGVQNDFYINTSTGDYYKKTGFATWTFQTNLTGPTGPQGFTGPSGPQGLTGQTGAQGIQGPQGLAGTNGINGTNGLNGATWLNGITIPASNLGVQNDFYINTTNGDYYKKTGFATWTVQANLTGSAGPQGPAGPQGLQGLQGLTGQTGAQGIQGLQGSDGINGTNGTNGINGATWLSGTTVPAGTLGVQNDFYINTTNGDYYKKTGFATWTFQTNLTGPVGPQGLAGPQGVQGTQGLTGQTGAQGIQGVQGSAGTNGTNGVNGTVWLSGTTLPSGSSGVQNDFYINTSTGDYYKKTGSTTWTLQANLTGPAGPQGNQGIQGLTGLTGATGSNGTNGTNGATWLSGTTSPTTSLGSVNDFYINTSTGDYYKKTGSSTWTLQANLTGPAGQQGVSSIAFIKSFKIDETSSGQIPYWDLLSFSLESNSSIEIEYELTSKSAGGYHTCQIWVDTITDEIQIGSFDEASDQIPASRWPDSSTTNASDSVIIKNVSNATRNYVLRLNKNSVGTSTIKVRVVCRKFY